MQSLSPVDSHAVKGLKRAGPPFDERPGEQEAEDEEEERPEGLDEEGEEEPKEQDEVIDLGDESSLTEMEEEHEEQKKCAGAGGDSAGAEEPAEAPRADLEESQHIKSDDEEVADGGKKNEKNDSKSAFKAWSLWLGAWLAGQGVRLC